jgi:vacuolar-type H+-ATPase subunit D/Vma8
MLAPNKQNLLLLKRQAKTMANGYKLLKEKRTGLVVTFLDLARQGQQLENQIQGKIRRVLNNYRQSMTFVSRENLVENLENLPNTKLVVSKQRISGVYVDQLHLDVASPDRPNLKPDLNQSLKLFAGSFGGLIKLSQIKLNCQKIALEIQKTNRQIASLEGKIEETKAQIKFIKDTLDEKANLEKATLIHIFG